MAESKIEWTNQTWNPTTGCDKISAGCKNCYAERLAARLKAMGQNKYRNGFKLTLHPDTLNLPFKMKAGSRVFVNSMSDLFHKDVPDEFLKKVFDVMNKCPTVTFQVLTKRADRLSSISEQLTWSENIWMGVSVEDDRVKDRIDHLRKINAHVKFLSIEPLIGSVGNIDLKGIDWVIVGGESGPGSRPILEEWVIDIHDQCKSQNVPFFFKQWGGVNKKKTGRLLFGREFNEYPEKISHLAF